MMVFATLTSTAQSYNTQMEILVEFTRRDRVVSARRTCSELANERSGNHEVFRMFGVLAGQLITELAGEFDVPIDVAIDIFHRSMEQTVPIDVRWSTLTDE